MTKSLTINGKKYIPSNVLAARFKYTPDYIAKLARDEKIIGTQIGRQWFIEPGSLETFLHQVSVEKNIRKEELSRKRKIEHAAHQKVEEQSALPASLHLEALAQTAIVVFCGFFVGGLGFVAVTEDIGVSELASGAEHTIKIVAQEIFHLEFSHTPSSLIAASAESERKQVTSAPLPWEEKMVYTILPEFPERDVIATSSAVLVDELKEEAGIAEQFSDEVRVLSTEEGEMIVPVFRSGEYPHGYLLVPIDNQNGYE